MAALIASLSAVTTYAILLPIVLVIQVILVFLGLVVENLVTAEANPTQYGRVSAVFEGLKDAGKFVGAVAFGFALDYIGPQPTFICLAIMILVVMSVSLGAKYSYPR